MSGGERDPATGWAGLYADLASGRAYGGAFTTKATAQSQSSFVDRVLGDVVGGKASNGTGLSAMCNYRRARSWPGEGSRSSERMEDGEKTARPKGSQGIKMTAQRAAGTATGSIKYSLARQPLLPSVSAAP